MKRVTLAQLAIALVLMFLASACSRLPDSAQAAGNDNSDPAATPSGPFTQPGVTVPEGTTIAIRLQQAVSSASAHPGEEFDAVLDDPVVVDGQEVLPRGLPVVGQVVAARHSGHLHNAGYLRLTLASITIHGQPVPLQTSSIFVAGASQKKRDIALIGGGAGAGALIGALAGGGKGALIGSLIGGGAGTGTAYATGKRDVGFGAERRLDFRLLQPIMVR